MDNGLSPDKSDGNVADATMASGFTAAEPSEATQPHDIIRIDDLHIAIDLKGTDLDVVRGTSFRITAGKTYALVGES